MGLVIVMTHAKYGRMRSDDCVRNEQMHIGCQQVKPRHKYVCIASTRINKTIDIYLGDLVLKSAKIITILYNIHKAKKASEIIL